MTRVILIAAALVGALIALLVWISSPADDRLKTQNELIDGKVNSLGRRTGERPRVAANWPRKAAHVLIQIAYPKDDPRAARGGATLASLRGNGVTYRRKSVNEAALERHRVPVAAVEGALAVASQLLEGPTPAGFTVTIDVGKGAQNRSASESDAAGLLSLLKGRSDAWTPPALALKSERTPEAPSDEIPTWPSLPALGPPQRYQKSETLRAPSQVIRTLLKALQSNDRFTFEGVVYRVVRWEPVNPS